MPLDITDFFIITTTLPCAAPAVFLYGEKMFIFSSSFRVPVYFLHNMGCEY